MAPNTLNGVRWMDNPLIRKITSFDRSACKWVKAISSNNHIKLILLLLINWPSTMRWTRFYIVFFYTKLLYEYTKSQRRGRSPDLFLLISSSSKRFFSIWNIQNLNFKSSRQTKRHQNRHHRRLHISHEHQPKKSRAVCIGKPKRKRFLQNRRLESWKKQAGFL